MLLQHSHWPFLTKYIRQTQQDKGSHRCHVACVCIGTPGSGKETWCLSQYVEGVDYVTFANFTEALFSDHKQSQSNRINKSEINALLGLAQSDREMELIRYSIL